MMNFSKNILVMIDKCYHVLLEIAMVTKRAECVSWCNGSYNIDALQFSDYFSKCI